MSSKGKTILAIVVGVILTFIMVIAIAYNTPGGREMINSYLFRVQTSDDMSNYETRKKVEDTCRAMISSYESDRLAYEQYKDSESEEKQGWAEQAKMRANKTASSYNNFILTNSFVWNNNVPSDIKTELEYIE